MIIFLKKVGISFGSLNFFSYVYTVMSGNPKNTYPMNLENLFGETVVVIVSKDGKVGSKKIKVCKVKARSVLFIEVDKENRKNIFWKVDKKNIEKVGTKTTGEPFILIVDGYLLSENKWESHWDSIGSATPGGNTYGQKHFSNHSKGWAPQYHSTTNSRAGFPMV